MPTIITKNSSTASSVPTNAQLVQGELAVNVTDKRLFTENASGTVVELGTNPSSLTLPNGTANGVPYLNASKVLTSGSALTFDGTNFAISGGLFSGDARLGQSGTKDIAVIVGNTAGSGPQIRALSFNEGAYAPLTSLASFFAWNPAGSEQMRLTSTGLGIGTSSPSVKLHVASTGRDVAIIESTDAGALNGPYLNLYRNSASPAASDYLGFLQFSGKNSTGIAVDYAFIGAQATQVTTSPAQKGDLVFFTANQASPAERMRIDSSGNLGLGVTPSAGIKLQIGSGEVMGFMGPGGAWATNSYYQSGFKYATTAAAAKYDQANGAHLWFTAPSGTAGNAISFTQAMTLDASGNLGVGTTGQVSRISATGSSGTDFNALTLRNSSGTDGSAAVLTFESSSGTEGSAAASVAYIKGIRVSSGATGALAFWTTNGGTPAERARIDSSGNLLVGTTTSGVGNTSGMGIGYNGGASYASIGHTSGTASGSVYVSFGYNGGAIANITQNGTTGVLYNLTSDYRLKNNPVPLTGSGEFIDALQPKTWDWHDGSGKGVGFIAHEFMEVAKYSGNGEKDAVDAEGNPIYQSIQPSSSEVMAYLVAELQSLRKRVAELEAK